MSKVIAKHSRLPRKSAVQEPQTELQEIPATTAEAPRKRFSLEQRTEILESAKALLCDGLKIKEIAEKNEVPERTLQLWVHNSDDADLIRLWVTSVLMDVDEDFDSFDTKDINAHIKLATLREKMKRAWWYAEKRDRPRYGEDKFQVNVGIVPVLNITTVAIGNDQPQFVIEGEKPLLIEEKK